MAVMGPPGDDDNYKGPEDKLLWAYVTRDVKPLKGGGGKRSKSRKVSGEARARERPDAAAPPAAKTPRARDTDKRTADRVRRGEMKIDDRLDLHGLSQREAHQRLNAFIIEAYAMDKRYLLVITGKGARHKISNEDWTGPVPGVLRRRVPEWLDEPPLRDIVLQVHPARPQHGGDGALYVLLRRRRPAT